MSSSYSYSHSQSNVLMNKDKVLQQPHDSTMDSGFHSSEGSLSSNFDVSNSLEKVQSNSSLVPRHELDSNTSDYSSGYSSHKDSHHSTDSAYGSSPLSSLGSVPEDKETHAEVPVRLKPKYNNYLELFAFLVNLRPDYREWTPKDFDGVLSKSSVTEAGNDTWLPTPDDEDGDFEALNAARDRDEYAAAFALFVAPDAKTLNTRNLDRKTVLHVAAEQLDPKLVRMYITKGADGAMTDLWGNTPLHVAAKLGRAEVVVALTTKIARSELGHPRYKVPYRSLPQDNKDQMNNDGRSPIHLATQGRHAAAVSALADAKVDLDQRRLGDGFAPLHIAIENGDYACTKVLLEKGADLEVRNHKGETPQQLAHLCGRTDLVKLCDEYGASPHQLDLAETEQAVWSSSEDDSDMDTDSDELHWHMQQMDI